MVWFPAQGSYLSQSLPSHSSPGLGRIRQQRDATRFPVCADEQTLRNPLDGLTTQPMSTEPRPVAVVTGAAHGIGAATAALAVEAGFAVALLDRDEEAVRANSRELGERARRALSVACDVSDEAAVRAAFRRITAELGRPSALVTSAGVDRGGRIGDLEARTWDRVMNVNLRGTFLCCREAVRAMCQLGGGAIVCISSPFALVSAEAVTAYASSKAGVCSLVRSIAVDYARAGIRANALLPGPTETELMWANVVAAEIDATRDAVRREVPLGRLAQPEEIARIALWLLSDAASYITGTQLSCDGGLLARAAISV